MTNFVPSITETQILTALRAFLLQILPAGVEVVRGQSNRVPEPASPDYVVMTHVRRSRLDTNTVVWDASNPAPDSLQHSHSTASDVQLDIHGPNGTDNAQVIATLFRDDYGCTQIDDGLFAPLYATDGNQMPFINGEGQFEDRWVMTVTLQSTPIISTPMQFADTVTATLLPIGSANP